MRQLEKDGLRVREHQLPDRRETIVEMFDNKTGYQYRHHVDPMQAHDPSFLIGMLHTMRKQMEHIRREKMGHYDDFRISAGAKSAAASTTDWKMQMVRNDYELPSDYGRVKPSSKFFRLGNECSLQEGATFEEPLDALRLSIARWLKK